MSWVATAVVGGSIIGGMMSNNAAGTAADAQRDATDTQAELAREQFDKQNQLAAQAAEETRAALTPFLDQLARSADASRQAALSGAGAAGAAGLQGIDTATAYSDALLFQMQGEFSRWNQIYGPLQENLSHFYQQLSPESLIATGLESSQQAFQSSLKTLQRSFAQRGLDTGAESLLAQQATLSNATERAKLRYEAPFKVADAQQSFLANTSSIQNPYTQAVQGAVGNRQQLALARGQWQANTINSQTAAELNYQSDLSNAAAARYQAERDIAETKGNVASRSQTDLTHSLQAAAAARGQITANQAYAQANAIGNVVNTGIGMYAMRAARNPSTPPVDSPSNIGVDTYVNPELDYSLGG
ncbi:MAG: hypothetical protein JHC33_09160 [Ignisphaera sp.]|nr:hypothetical protein [Ignisphaera sp.]